MERALLQGERQVELDQMEAESDVITQLQRKLDELENAVQREKDEVRRRGGTLVVLSLVLSLVLFLVLSRCYPWCDPWCYPWCDPWFFPGISPLVFPWYFPGIIITG